MLFQVSHRYDLTNGVSANAFWYTPFYRSEEQERSEAWIYGNKHQNLMERFTRRVCRVIFKTIFDKLRSKNYDRDEINRLFELDAYYSNRLKDFASRNV